MVPVNSNFHSIIRQSNNFSSVFFHPHFSSVSFYRFLKICNSVSIHPSLSSDFFCYLLCLVSLVLSPTSHFCVLSPFNLETTKLEKQSPGIYSQSRLPISGAFDNSNNNTISQSKLLQTLHFPQNLTFTTNHLPRTDNEASRWFISKPLNYKKKNQRLHTVYLVYYMHLHDYFFIILKSQRLCFTHLY